MESDLVHKSKFLSLVLRHKPDEIGLTLDPNGWVDVQELITKANSKGIRLDATLLDEIVEKNDKKRFAFNSDKTKIRANQGHSLTTVDLQLKPTVPPDTLYHGTATRFWDSIVKVGLIKGSRQYVHLSPDEKTAIKVGQRHGTPKVLKIDAKTMHDKGIEFFISDNGVWLTDFVASEYIKE
jgi:putative RNA 2'-phosphotransferase